MQPLTDHERESLVSALELCAELGIETGWSRYMFDGGYWCRKKFGGAIFVPACDRYDYRSLCEAIAEWLEDHETVSSVSTANLNGRKHRVMLSRESVERGIYEEADCKLAALTAAAKGVGK